MFLPNGSAEAVDRASIRQTGAVNAQICRDARGEQETCRASVGSYAPNLTFRASHPVPEGTWGKCDVRTAKNSEKELGRLQAESRGASQWQECRCHDT